MAEQNNNPAMLLPLQDVNPHFFTRQLQGQQQQMQSLVINQHHYQQLHNSHTAELRILRGYLQKVVSKKIAELPQHSQMISDLQQQQQKQQQILNNMSFLMIKQHQEQDKYFKLLVGKIEQQGEQTSKQNTQLRKSISDQQEAFGKIQQDFERLQKKFESLQKEMNPLTYPPLPEMLDDQFPEIPGLMTPVSSNPEAVHQKKTSQRRATSAFDLSAALPFDPSTTPEFDLSAALPFGPSTTPASDQRPPSAAT
jgi:hypothetical protein